MRNAIGLAHGARRLVALALLLNSNTALAEPQAAGERPGTEAPPAVVVFAAASLTDALNEVGRTFTARPTALAGVGAAHIPVRTSFAASSVLAKQIEAGAPAEVFLSADTAWMDYLEQRNLLRAGTRENLLGNVLVLVAPAASTAHVTLAPHVDLTAALAGGRLATGDPDSVPVGRYAEAALKSLSIWGEVEPRLVRAESVRTALEYVARGEATLGIVYRTDALVEKRVRAVGVFPADSYPPIVYPVALTARAGERAAAFEAFLGSDTAREIFTRYGFELLPLRTSRSGSP
jgi:molybdate transport system substrate-binding protein